jgi:nitroimidazol reductase NimA-like FMN-containing flavoprotein (pyridoxamine 5'-phosphate oxidase superfamily)
MVIHVMTTEECLRFLGRSRLARLACARENQPYVVPVYLAYHSSGGGACLYGFTTPGQKVEWMRANPLVCVEMDEVTSDVEWTSVIAFGRYDEISGAAGGDSRRRPARVKSSDESRAAPETTARESERRLAHEVFQAHAMWWEPAAATARARSDPAGTFNPIFYKILINRVTGQRATQG